jgi:type II secretory pathway pseudopilin PulG
MKLPDFRMGMRPAGACKNQFSEGRVTRVPDLPRDPVTSSGTRVTRPSVAAFTMVEIAIALGVIGFALVAIIGVLPIGINVQKENREETIVNQEASVFLNAIRFGERGLNDLTNYVMVITNYNWRVTEEYVRTNIGGLPPRDPDQVNWYTFAAANINGAVRNDLRLINGARIIGLLSTPRYVPVGNEFDVNQVVGYFRAMSGGAAEKPPQNNQDTLMLAFSYRLIPELAPVPKPDTNVTVFSRNYDTNLHELRLAFRWPILPNGQLGNSRAAFRTLAGGRFAVTNDTGQNLYFLQPSTFAAAQ